MQVDQQNEGGAGSEVVKDSKVVDQPQVLEHKQVDSTQIVNQVKELVQKTGSPGIHNVSGTIINNLDNVEPVEKPASKSPEKPAVEKPTQTKEQNKNERSQDEEDEEAEEEEGDGENEVKEKEKDDKGENKVQQN